RQERPTASRLLATASIDHRY
ncbi:hypothetical protein LSH36_835g00016, partial [Paralvinella palmiformis]